MCGNFSGKFKVMNIAMGYVYVYSVGKIEIV